MKGLLTHTHEPWPMSALTHYNKIHSDQGNQPDGIRLLPESTLLRSQFGYNILQSTGIEIKACLSEGVHKIFRGKSNTAEEMLLKKNIFFILDKSVNYSFVIENAYNGCCNYSAVDKNLLK